MGILFTAAMLNACGEEAYIYPNLITEMTCLKTNSEGIGTEIITDNGQVWHLQEGNRPDSENCIIGGKPMSKAVEQTV